MDGVFDSDGVVLAETVVEGVSVPESEPVPEGVVDRVLVVLVDADKEEVPVPEPEFVPVGVAVSDGVIEKEDVVLPDIMEEEVIVGVLVPVPEMEGVLEGDAVGLAVRDDEKEEEGLGEGTQIGKLRHDEQEAR